RFGVTPRCNAETGRYEKIGSAAGRVARNGKSWWRRFGVSPRCNAGTDETFSRRLCAEMFRLSPDCPERPIRTASLRSHHGGLSRIRADAVASPIFSHVPDETVPYHILDQRDIGAYRGQLHLSPISTTAS